MISKLQFRKRISFSVRFTYTNKEYMKMSLNNKISFLYCLVNKVYDKDFNKNIWLRTIQNSISKWI